MKQSKSLSWLWFWVGFATLFALMFTLNYNVFVMPDALSLTAGGVLGSYLFAYIVWVVTRFAMKARTPEYKFFVSVLAALSVASQAFPLITKLMG